MIIANIAKKMEKTKNTAIFVYLFFLKLLLIPSFVGCQSKRAEKEKNEEYDTSDHQPDVEPVTIFVLGQRAQEEILHSRGEPKVTIRATCSLERAA